jgi:hypothetical protein
MLRMPGVQLKVSRMTIVGLVAHIVAHPKDDVATIESVFAGGGRVHRHRSVSIHVPKLDVVDGGPMVRASVCASPREAVIIDQADQIGCTSSPLRRPPEEGPRFRLRLTANAARDRAEVLRRRLRHGLCVLGGAIKGPAIQPGSR